MAKIRRSLLRRSARSAVLDLHQGNERSCLLTDNAADLPAIEPEMNFENALPAGAAHFVSAFRPRSFSALNLLQLAVVGVAAAPFGRTMPFSAKNR
jgi:hypothetical protein